MFCTKAMYAVNLTLCLPPRYNCTPKHVRTYANSCERERDRKFGGRQRVNYTPLILVNTIYAPVAYKK